MEIDTMQNIFGDQLAAGFISGFPENWQDLVTSFNSHQQAIPNPPKKSPRIDPSSTAHKHTTKPMSKPRGRPAKKHRNSYSNSASEPVPIVTPVTKLAASSDRKPR